MIPRCVCDDCGAQYHPVEFERVCERCACVRSERGCPMNGIPKVAERSGPGRHEGQTTVERWVAEASLEGCEEAGDVEHAFGHYALVRFDEEERAALGEVTYGESLYFEGGAPIGAIVSTDSYGFVSVEYRYRTEDLEAAWRCIEAECAAAAEDFGGES